MSVLAWLEPGRQLPQRRCACWDTLGALASPAAAANYHLPGSCCRRACKHGQNMVSAVCSSVALAGTMCTRRAAMLHAALDAAAHAHLMALMGRQNR